MSPVHLNIDLHPEDEQLMRLERHSYINLINVVHAELQLIERMIEAPGKLRESIRLAEYASRAFKDREIAREHAEEFALFDESIERAVSGAVEESGEPGESDDVREAVGILESVLADAHCRLREVLARHGVSPPLRSLSAKGVQQAIQESFDGDFSVSCPQEVDGLPVGLLGTLGRLLRALRESQGKNRESQASEYTLGIDSADSSADTWRQVTVEGPAEIEAFSLLSSGLLPSQLHEHIRSGQPQLRGMLEFYYYSLPNGSIRLEQAGLIVRADCLLGSTK